MRKCNSAKNSQGRKWKTLNVNILYNGNKIKMVTLTSQEKIFGSRNDFPGMIGRKKYMNNIRTNCLSLDNSNEANMPLQKH